MKSTIMIILPVLDDTTAVYLKHKPNFITLSIKYEQINRTRLSRMSIFLTLLSPGDINVIKDKLFRVIQKTKNI